MLLDQVAREPAETLTLAIAVKGRSEDKSEPGVGVR